MTAVHVSILLLGASVIFLSVAFGVTTTALLRIVHRLELRMSALPTLQQRRTQDESRPLGAGQAS